MNRLLTAITSMICLCLVLTSCGTRRQSYEEGGKNNIAPIQQEVMTFDKNINAIYGNTCGNLPMAEDDDNYYFMNSPKITIVEKNGERTSGFKIFTDKCDINKFIVYDKKIFVINSEDGLVTCDVKGNNISIKKHNDKKITDIYIENNIIYFVTAGEEDGSSDIFSESLSGGHSIDGEYEDQDDEENVIEKIATIMVPTENISDFAAVGTDVYLTYTDEYKMQILLKINGIAQLPLQSLPPEFCQKNKAFTDGGYIYMSSSINKIVRYDTLNNNVTEIATVGEPINARNGYIYIINQTSLKDVEIISYNVKTQEATIIYKNSDNNVDKEYNNDENSSVMIKSLGVFDDGVVFVEEYTTSNGEQKIQTYKLNGDKELEKI